MSTVAQQTPENPYLQLMRAASAHARANKALTPVDTGVTSDGDSLISHDQFLNPQSCRRADGKPYNL